MSRRSFSGRKRRVYIRYVVENRAVGVTDTRAQIGMFDDYDRNRELQKSSRRSRVVERSTSAWANTMSGRLERKSRSFAYLLRPNLLYTRKFVIVHSIFSASSEE